MMAEFADKYETLLLRRERARLHVTLNRPEVKNALNPTLIGELKQVFGILHDRRDIKVVILRGAGGTFCAGADLKNMEQSFSEKPKPGERDPIALNNREYGTFLEMVNTSPQVVVKPYGTSCSPSSGSSGFSVVNTRIVKDLAGQELRREDFTTVYNGQQNIVCAPAPAATTTAADGAAATAPASPGG